MSQQTGNVFSRRAGGTISAQTGYNGYNSGATAVTIPDVATEQSANSAPGEPSLYSSLSKDQSSGGNILSNPLFWAGAGLLGYYLYKR